MPATSPSCFTGIARPRPRALPAIHRTSVARRHRRRTGARVSAAGRRRSGAKGSRRRSRSRCARATASTGSRSTWPRSAWGWSSFRCTSTTIRTTSPGASRHAEARLLIVENPRLAASLARLAAPGIRCRGSSCCGRTTATRHVRGGLPAGGRRAGRRATARRYAGDDLLHVGHVGPAEGRDAVARQHHRQRRACRETGMARPDDPFLSILPLSHMFERTGGYYLPLSLGAKVAYCARRRAARRRSGDAGATAIFAVPRIFERFRARIEQALAASPLKRCCSTRASRAATASRRGRGVGSIACWRRCCAGSSARRCWRGWAGGCGWPSSAAPRSIPSSRARSSVSGCRCCRATA